MKRIILLLCLLMWKNEGYAQQPLVNPEDSTRTLLERVIQKHRSVFSANMNLQFYTSGAAYLTEGKLDEAAFKLNRMRLEILGTFSERFSYHFRQSFNKYRSLFTG